MKTHDLIQKSPEWLAYRATMRNASDAPAMMGASEYKTRTQLLRELRTGMAAEVDAHKQALFDSGHRFEAWARPLGEEIVGEDLYPVTGSEGRLSASFDGLTLDERLAWEHKRLNDALRAILPVAGVGGPDVGAALLAMYRIQMEQQCMVSGAERVLFTASSWTAEGDLVEARHCWYEPDAELRAAILRGWDQFEADLAAYVIPSAAEPAPVGKAPDQLPALRIEVSGQVTASNLAEFKQTALAAIRSVNRNLATDQDFADAEKAVKWCADVESRIATAKEHALSQTASIDALFKTLDDIAAESKRVRLDVDKLVTRRKVEVREHAVVAARSALDAHIAILNAELAPFAVRQPAADFAGAIKGKRSIASMQDALDTVLAGAKIEADASARALRANLALFKAQAAGVEFLFSDLGQIAHKAADDFAALLTARIETHKAAEAERARKAAEAEAQRIAAAEQRAREQEAARIAAQQAAAAAAELAAQRAESARLEALAVANRAALAAQDTERQGSQQVLKAEGVSPDATDRETPAATSPRVGAMGVGQAADAAPAAEPATLNLGAICGRLGFTVSAQFLAEVLHVAPAKTDKASKLYTESQFRAICRQLVSHVSAMAELYAGEAA